MFCCQTLEAMEEETAKMFETNADQNWDKKFPILLLKLSDSMHTVIGKLYGLNSTIHFYSFTLDLGPYWENISPQSCAQSIL